MKPIITTFFILFIFNTLNAQFEFEPGYFIDNEGNRMECYIKNMAWKNNPSQFEYKLDLESEPKIANQFDIQEFGINGIAKYEKRKVIIDTYYTKLSKKSNDSNFNYEEKELMLSVIEEGEATLYEYQTKHYKRYLFKVGSGPVEQFVNKSFISIEELKGTKLGYARKYKVQLYKNLSCEGITIKEINKVNYHPKSLRKFFNRYNLCSTGTSKNYYNIKKGLLSNKRARIGIGLANFTGLFDGDREIVAFKNSISFRVGVEYEYMPPHLEGTFSFTAEPGFFFFSKYSSSLLNRGPGKLHFHAIQIPFGFRYNQFFSKNIRMYMSFLVDAEIPIISKLKYETNPLATKISSQIQSILFGNFAIGIGLIHNNLNIELRHRFNRTNDAATFYEIRHNVTDLIFGIEF